MGIYDWDAALHELSASADEERRLRSATDWQSERPGSSGFILSSVTGTAMSVFWRLLQGKQRESAWLHFNANDLIPEWEDWTAHADAENCRLCSPEGLRGLGDCDLTGSDS